MVILLVTMMILIFIGLPALLIITACISASRTTKSEEAVSNVSQSSI